MLLGLKLEIFKGDAIILCLADVHLHTNKHDCGSRVPLTDLNFEGYDAF